MYNADKNELKVLKFWDKDKTFEKSIAERPVDKPYVFYDGPPFATGTPHYGHFPSSIMKDVVPRYMTMNGYRVERVWGWDCHGLPIENIVEKELGTKSKKDIEELGVAKFNELCRAKVLGYVDVWKKTINRLGRWVDMENAYHTMDLTYMESVWWVFKELWDKDLIYEGHRSMHVCPRCETTLSQQEVSEGYMNVKDLSVTVEFRIKNSELKTKLFGEKDASILAWTTTPWTLPGNLLLAVGESIEYIVFSIKEDNGVFVVAKDLVDKVIQDTKYKILNTIKGKDMVGLTYEPNFPYFADTDNAFRMVAGDFVNTEEGTGIVHIAPGFGQDDYELGQAENLPVAKHLGLDGVFYKDLGDLAGLDVKPRAKGKPEEIREADLTIVKDLKKRGLVFNSEKYDHSYPHCWRCDTALINFVTSAWFVAVTKIKTEALKQAKEINWFPDHIKVGRFGKWLHGARDWSISRQRFWASVMPIWICEKNKDHKIVFGAVKDLEEKSGQKINDLHKHILDTIIFNCEECKGTMRRIPDVLDTWFDSGSMPYAQSHYPFENKEKFEASFPAEFIAEGQDQTRAWFYYLHVLATSIKKKPAFQNVIVNGIVLAEDGKKMSKKLKNYIDPNTIFETYGADALRYYMLSSPVLQAENMNLSEDGVREVFNKVINTLWNVLEFYKQFANKTPNSDLRTPNSTNVLDKWILSKLNILLKVVTDKMSAYDLPGASRPIQDFVLDLSQWYVRRSRDRFKGDDEEDKQAAIATLREVLTTLSKLMAPFTPFIAESVWHKVKGEGESVHLQEWPKVDESLIDEDLETAMLWVRNFVTMGHSHRKEKGINVRQPLASFVIKHDARPSKYWEECKYLLEDELNVKEVILRSGDQDGPPVDFDWEISEELKKEGLAREIIRAINQQRKEKKLTRSDQVSVLFRSNDEILNNVIVEFGEYIKKQTRISNIETGGDVEIVIENLKFLLGVNKL
jgi:isoleucyl-tRNA synthetase